MRGRKPKDITYKVDINGCHICTSHAIHKNGYIYIRINKKLVYLHRFIYEENIKLIEKDNVLRHTCDNPSCINPNHLIEGTQADNIQDRVNRNRSAKGITQGFAKLNEEQVLEIFNNSIDSNANLARKYKMAHNTIKSIRTGKTWKHITQSKQKSLF